MAVFISTARTNINRRALCRRCVVSRSQYSFDTDYQRSIDNGSRDFATKVETGWLWESSARTTKSSLNLAGIRPKKSLGQNFVTDTDVLERIVHATGIESGEPVIEFGPGTGNLTRYLLKSGADVTAIEKDDVLQQRLKDAFEQETSLKVMHADVMNINIPKLIGEITERYPDRSKMKIVSNLPYNITTDCLKLYLPMGHIVSNLMFMIQDEVARRLCDDTTGSAEYRAMNVYVHHFSRPKYLFKIKSTAYSPRPLVDGALVDFELKPPEERDVYQQESKFLSFVNKAFSSKRKKLVNGLKSMYDPEAVKSVLDRLKIPETVRGQEMDYRQFVSVFSELEGIDDAT